MQNSPALSEADPLPEAIESALIGGDLSKLSAAHRVMYYNRTCESLGLNALTRPFEYIRLNGKLVLYAKKDATEQLRKNSGVSIEIVRSEKVGDIYLVQARGKDSQGRTDESTGAVSINGLKGDGLANAIMKAETKAKRRVTLSLCGLGMLDETEAETIPSAELVTDSPAEHIEEASAEIVTILDNPSEHILQGNSPTHKGSALKDIPAEWMSKAVSNKRFIKELTQDDLANIGEYLHQLEKAKHEVGG